MEEHDQFQGAHQNLLTVNGLGGLVWKEEVYLLPAILITPSA